MATKTTSKGAAKAKFSEVQDHAKAAYEKGVATLGDVKEFARGNLDAVVESGKIAGAGLKQLGEGYVAEGRGAIAAFNADIKDLTAARSPIDFFKLQSQIFGRNLGAAIDFHSKNAEAVLKLARDSAEPLSKRVGVALETVRKAA